MENDLINKRDLKEYIRKSDLVSREKAALLWAAEHVPTISPDSLRKRGRWVNKAGKLFCGECGGFAKWESDGGFWSMVATSYCPSCGARMDLEG